MEFRIHTSYSEVSKFLATVQTQADANRRALGFLPASVYQQSAMQGKLWIVARQDDNSYSGHLLFGGSYPYLKVAQIFVSPNRRRLAVGSRLIEALITYGEQYNYISISARVADDLPANRFWEHHGFQCAKQISGGRTTGRRINIRVRFLDVPLLFEQTELRAISPLPNASTIEYEGTPVLQSPSYALDINTLIDLLQHRDRYDPVSAMFQAGFDPPSPPRFNG